LAQRRPHLRHPQSIFLSLIPRISPLLPEKIFPRNSNNNYPSTKAVSGSVTCFALQNLTIGCSNCIYSTGKVGPSQSVSCSSVPANGSATDASAICPSPTGSGGNLSGGNLQLSVSSSSPQSWAYIDIGTIQVTYNTNQDSTFGPAGYVSIKVFDVAGRLVDEMVNTTQEASYYTEVWDASEFEKGIYVIEIHINETITARERVVKQ